MSAVSELSLVSSHLMPPQQQRLCIDDVIRDLSHELRQPLSAIETIAYYIEMTLPDDRSDARQQLLRIQELVGHCSAILSKAVPSERAASA